MKVLRVFGMLVVVFGALLQSSNASAVDFSQINISWRYDVNAEVQFTHRVVTSGNDRLIFLSVEGEKLRKWKWEFLVQNGYESEDDRKIEVEIDTLSSLPDSKLLKLKIANVPEDLLVIKLIGYERYLFYDVPLAIGKLSFPSIYPLDQEGLPIIQNHTERAQVSWEGDSSFLAVRYPEIFEPADPPMVERSLIPSARSDTAFYVKDTVFFQDDYFYVVRKDSLSTTAVTLLKVPPYFPEYRRLNELIDAMLYITTAQERKALVNSRSPKASFDSFWMNTFSTKAFARNAIRRYYNKVAYANRLFTDFMPGWKTDRGMIYIVFGKPDEVYRTANTEEWYYINGDSFEFNIISSFFAPKTYTLRRNIELEEAWYNQIAAIRSGIE